MRAGLLLVGCWLTSSVLLTALNRIISRYLRKGGRQ